MHVLDFLTGIYDGERDIFASSFSRGTILATVEGVGICMGEELSWHITLITLLKHTT
jgi:hypothetical protein